MLVRPSSGPGPARQSVVYAALKAAVWRFGFLYSAKARRRNECLFLQKQEAAGEVLEALKKLKQESLVPKWGKALEDGFSRRSVSLPELKMVGVKVQRPEPHPSPPSTVRTCENALSVGVADAVSRQAAQRGLLPRAGPGPDRKGVGPQRSCLPRDRRRHDLGARGRGVFSSRRLGLLCAIPDRRNFHRRSRRRLHGPRRVPRSFGARPLSAGFCTESCIDTLDCMHTTGPGRDFRCYRRSHRPSRACAPWDDGEGVTQGFCRSPSIDFRSCFRTIGSACCSMVRCQLPRRATDTLACGVGQRDQPQPSYNNSTVSLTLLRGAFRSHRAVAALRSRALRSCRSPGTYGEACDAEAAHFLIAYLLAVPVVGYDIGLGREHTDLAEAKLQVRA